MTSPVLEGGRGVITQVTPSLRMRQLSSTSDSSATKLGGTSYSPTVGDLVLFVHVEKRVYVLGTAP